MALVKMKDLLRRAEEKNIGCGAFSVGNMEMVRGCLLYTSPSPRDTR